jgi:hypothetical protein
MTHTAGFHGIRCQLDMTSVLYVLATSNKVNSVLSSLDRGYFGKVRIHRRDDDEIVLDTKGGSLSGVRKGSLFNHATTHFERLSIGARIVRITTMLVYFNVVMNLWQPGVWQSAKAVLAG